MKGRDRFVFDRVGSGARQLVWCAALVFVLAVSADAKGQAVDPGALGSQAVDPRGATRDGGDGRDGAEGVARAEADSLALDRELRKPKIGIENIVVTSRKRLERAQRIPISISAISAQDLQDEAVDRIPAISPLIPNANFDRQSGSNGRLTIRGLTEFDPNPAVDPAVGTYVDGVYQGRQISAEQSLFDIERIEVLRGPQGTIFGKNALGGAINIETKAPGFDRDGVLSVKVGNFRELETLAAFNVPLVDEVLSTRFALTSRKRDGFQKRLNGNDRDDDAVLAGRFSTLYFPRENVELLFSYDYNRERKQIPQGKCFLTDTSGLQDPASFQSVLAVVGFQDACDTIGRSRNPFRVGGEVSPDEDVLTEGVTGRLTWALSPELQFTSLSSWRYIQNTVAFDFDSTDINIVSEVGESQQNAYSQEFQLAGSTMGDDLEYLVGLYALLENSTLKNPRGGLFNSLSADDIVFPIPDIDGDGDPTNDAAATAAALRGAQEDNHQKNDNFTYALFGQVRYNVTSKLQLVGGLRFERDRRRIFKSVTAVTVGPCASLGGTTPVAVGTICNIYDRSERYSDFQPSAALNYRWSDQVLTYVSYATGFKAGSFNPRSINNDLPGFVDLNGTFVPGVREKVSIDPAKLTTYEVGFKGTFSDERIRVNASAFYSVYESIQTLTASSFSPDAIVPGFGNGGDSVITGLEVETTFLPTTNLKLGLNGGILNDRYTDFDEPFMGQPGRPVIGDGRLPFTSRYSYAITLDYRLDTAIGEVALGAAWRGRTKQFFDPENTEGLAQGKMGLLSGHVTIDLPDGDTQIVLVGTNLLDRRFKAIGVDFTGLFGSKTLFPGAPRQYGIQIRRTF